MQPIPMATTYPNVAPPRRSRRRWYVFGGFVLQVLAAPVAYYFFASWWGDRQMAELTRQIEAEDPHWRWADLLTQIKPPPDEKNSALQIIKVQALLKKAAFNPGPKWDSPPKDPLLHRNARLSHENAELLRAAFAALAKETLPEARKLKDMPQGHFTIPAAENPFLMNLDYVQETRSVANLLFCDAILRGHDGELDGAAESCAAILNTARPLKDQPFLIAQLVRIAEQFIAVSAIERTLGQGTLSEANLQKLQALLESEADDDGLHNALRGERAAAHQTYLNLRTGKTTLSEIFGTAKMKMSLGERMLDVFPGLILNSYPEYLRQLTERVRASKMKDPERQEAFDKLDQQVREQRARLLGGNLLISLMMPATGKVGEATQRSQAQLRSTIAAIAAERYRLKHDAWPRGLDDLVKEGLLKEVYTDPYDGKPLRFKRTPTGIVIYSVGYNKVDNGGTLNRADPRAAGSDIGFELWDRRGLPPPPDRELPR